jgi:hypothetical protein
MDFPKPGLTIHLVVEIDTIREKIDVRSSTIYDILGKEFVIAQPDYRLSPARIKNKVTISYLEREKGIFVRYGFLAEIVKFITEYQLSSSLTAPAIVVVPKSTPKPYNLRFNYRIEPPSSFPINLSFYGHPVTIINISLRGALITIPRDIESAFEVGNIEKMTMTIDDQSYDIEVIIKRLTLPDDFRGGKKLKYIAVQFFTRNVEMEFDLWRKIIDVQRELLAKGLEP